MYNQLLIIHMHIELLVYIRGPIYSCLKM